LEFKFEKFVASGEYACLENKTNKPGSNSSCTAAGIEELQRSRREIESTGAASKETTVRQRQPNAKHTKQPPLQCPTCF